MIKTENNGSEAPTGPSFLIDEAKYEYPNTKKNFFVFGN